MIHCTTFRSDYIIKIWIRSKLNSHQIFIVVEKLVDKRADDMNVDPMELQNSSALIAFLPTSLWNQ